MAAPIACPSCGRLLRLPETYKGGKLRCPECQTIFAAGQETDITAQPLQPPAPLVLTEAEPEYLPEVEEPLPSRRRRRDIDDDDYDREDRPLPRRRRRRDEEDYDDDYDLEERLIIKGEYRPAGGLALAVKVLLALELLLILATLVSEYLQYALATRLVAGVHVPEAELHSNDLRQMVLGIFRFIIFVPTVVIFVMWFYRAHANLKPLGARDLTYTSGWAAGSWFVPILHLFRPVQIAQEIWRNSDPHFLDEEYGRFRTSGNSALIGFWWAMWIIANLIHNAAFRGSLAVETPKQLQIASMVAIIAEGATVVAGVLALAVVSRIDARQTARAEALEMYR